MGSEESGSEGLGLGQGLALRNDFGPALARRRRGIQRKLAAAAVGKGTVTQVGMILVLGMGISGEELELRVAPVGMTTSGEQEPERRETREILKNRSYRTDSEGGHYKMQKEVQPDNCEKHILRFARDDKSRAASSSWRLGMVM